ncbi:alkane 1-monooxygenase [Haematobacter missouriensis]|uniref:Luciferase-like monooxygenase n=1 Tax=Haematobacter missouriensis TaxID=366616 RepID=A0A212AY46_9RHOB|nr:LLM class flavin-dependent oxidoreductase [Haematobacter missouriensis]KFI27266.1 alkane 1-monooxygenase [Haematobacter missouriensis]OWJ77562.1 luciferase family oxidoreductase [Haematobacter missouriensis]OWJ86413.1 luciferase family oxidoreductase [Haematobacter missouriensis]
MQYSLLDLAPICEGQSISQAFASSRDLARHAEKWGYHRFWLAEHHGMPGIASAATAVVIGNVAGATESIRVGAGGIMLPNHSPLVIAEQFGTLAELYPGRIDLGLGRAPGTDMATAHALRRSHDNGDGFPQDVVDLMRFMGEADPSARIRAVPGEGTHVPVWILGSSLFGAQLAAYLGLPYAFASHFAPAMLAQAAETYRSSFRPSPHLEKPHFMMAIGVFAADTDVEAHYLRSSMILSFARLRTGQPGKFPPPVRDIESQIPASVLASVGEALSCSATGSPETVRRELSALIDRYRPDEVMLTGQIYDHAARLHSFDLAAKAMKEIGAAAMV